MVPHRIVIPLLRTTTIHAALIPLCCTLLLFSCGESPGMKSERTRLELAEMKGDLDGMFLSLRKLAELGDDTAANRISQVKLAVVAREQMLQAVADHDHEKAVHRATELLDIIPEHKDGLQILRESGQIFYYLRAAKHMVTASLNENEAQVITVEPIVIDPSLSGEERNILITKKIQKLLTALGHYYEEIDGKAGPETDKALKKFQDAREKSGVLQLSMGTANELQHVLNEKEAEEKRIERRFHSIARARELVTSAKALDPYFPGSISLDQSLERTHASLVYLQAEQIMTLGSLVVSYAADMHSTVSSGLGDAAASRYDSIQDAWTRMSPFVDDVKRILKRWEDDIDTRLVYVSTYKSGDAEEFVDLIKEYVTTVHVTVEALLEPTGSLRDFRRAANDAASEYSRMNTKLTGAMPSSMRIKESFEGLVAIVKDYAVFTNPQTDEIINQHEELYSL